MCHEPAGTSSCSAPVPLQATLAKDEVTVQRFEYPTRYPAPNPELNWADLYLPAGDQKVDSIPLAVLIHGGAWHKESGAGSFDHLARDLASRGMAVYNVEYRHIGSGGGWPVTFRDVADYVLARFDPVERASVPDVCARAVATLGDIGLIGQAMRQVYADARRPLHPAQVAEFKARVYYAAHLLAIVPDLICVLDQESAEPITTERLRYGQRVRVLGISTPDLMRTPEALATFGPVAQGRAAGARDPPAARRELRRLRRAEDARPDAAPGMGSRSRPDRPAHGDRGRAGREAVEEGLHHQVRPRGGEAG